MWIRPDVDSTNPNKWLIEADLKVSGNIHLDDNKSYLVDKGEVKELPIQMELKEV
jgi:hypothetical protein